MWLSDGLWLGDFYRAHYSFAWSSGAREIGGEEYAFLTQLIVETQPKIWEEVKQLYQERLRTAPYVQQGYINISAPQYADILIILTEESVERIKQLAQIDLDLNLKFSSLCLNVEYEHSTDFLNLHDFERFY